MKITLPGINLFEEKLCDKIKIAINEEIQKLDITLKYSLTLEFDESLIYCSEGIQSFSIPDEKLPQYQKGKEIYGDDKMYAILGYQLKVAEEAIESFGFTINHASIQGSPFSEVNCINVRLQEQEEKDIELDKKHKNEKSLKRSSIMPSLTGFAKNGYNAFEKIEKERDNVLGRAFNSKELYKKYKVLVGKEGLYKIYLDFKSEYGDRWIDSKDHRDELLKKFHQTVKIKAGLITDEKMKSEVIKPLIIPAKTIFELKVYKRTKTGNGMHKDIGQVSLMTNGKIIKIEYFARRKNYEIIDENFDDCYIEVNDRSDNFKLVNSIRELVEMANTIFEKYDFSINQDAMDNILDFIDIKRLIKKAREV